MQVEKKNYSDYLQKPIRSDRVELYSILPISQPLKILLDPSDICNFRCKFCFQSRTDFKGQLMTEEIFERVISQLKEFDEPINIIHLYNLGEPLLNKNISKWVKRILEEKVAKEVSVTTNGSMLSYEMSDALVEAGLTKITVSLNGLSDEDYERIVGRKQEFEQIYNQIKYFYKKRKQCHLHVKINGDDFSEESKERFVELFKDYADSINIDNVVDVWSDMSIAADRSSTMYDMGDLFDNESKVVCPQLFYEMAIHPDGTISPCNADYQYHKESMGNIFDSTIKEVWNGEKWNQMRINSLRCEKVGYAICEKCRYPVCASTVNITPHRKEILARMGKVE